MREERWCREVLVDGLLHGSFWRRFLCLYGLLISFQGLENLQHTEGWAVYFPCVVFMYWNIVVKIAGWGVMNVFKDLPLKEAFFQPLVVTTHFPVLCTTLSLFLPTKAPCVNLSANVPAGRDKMSWDTGPSLLKHQGLPPQMLVGIAQGPTGLDRKTWDLSTMLCVTLWTVYGWVGLGLKRRYAYHW